MAPGHRAIRAAHGVAAIALALLIANVPGSVTIGAEPSCSTPAAAAGLCGQELPALRATLYYTALEEDYPAGETAAFTDPDGTVLKRASPQFLAAAEIEGSALFRDGTLLNSAIVDGPGTSWSEAGSPFGLDARGCELVPFRSAAVDPRVVPLGTLLFIKATAGMLLPDGTRHDGLWLATDTGNDIVGDRIDLYLGQGLGQMAIPEAHGIDLLQALSVVAIASNEGCAGEAGLTSALTLGQ